MSQFDVFRNPDRQRDAAPRVVASQNNRFDRAATRFVTPLPPVSHAVIREHCSAPRCIIEGREVLLDVFNLATIPAERLGASVAALIDNAPVPN